LQAYNTELYPITYIDAPLWFFYELWGFEGMMTLIGERPDLVERACPHFTARTIDSVRKAAMLGAAGVWIWEGFADMISPQAYETFSVPWMRRMVGECRRLGIKSIHNFTGNPAGKLDAILSIGADALALEESKKDFVVDINELAAYVDGKCTLFGNLDAIEILQNGSDKQLRDAIAEQIAAGRRNHNRFVACLGSPVTPSTPVERVRLYCDLVRKMSQDQ
ncbi:MAG: uroporphyrinogen decarboxylase family protein, partial [Desulfobacterales bacterium]